jgi:RNA polymerase primary sigma factor
MLTHPTRKHPKTQAGVHGPHGLADATPSSPLSTYLREINDTPLLSPAEEQELADRVCQGDAAARDHLARANLRLVVRIARGFANRGLALPDLIAEGNLGLLRAVEAFDPTLDTRFSTYASYWIKQSILRALDNLVKPIRLPSYVVDLLAKWRRAGAELHDELGRQPAPEEVMDRLNLSPKKRAILTKALRIHNAVPQGDSLGDRPSLDELLSDENTLAPEAQMGRREELNHVLNLLGRLEPREETVLRLRYGLDHQGPRTLKQIGAHIGVTRERARQIERDALQKLSVLLQNE